MSTFTPMWGFEKPAATTQNKTSVYNADLDRLDEGRRLKAVAGTTLGANLLTYVSSGRLLRLATGANRPLAGFVSSSGTAVTTVASGSDVYAQVDGHIINSAWAFTPGLPVYAHPSAAGSITQTVPGSLAWPIAFAISSHQVAILPGGLHETHPTPEIFADLIITGTASVGGSVQVQSLFTARSAIVTEVASVGGLNVASTATVRAFVATQVASVGQMNASSGAVIAETTSVSHIFIGIRYVVPVTRTTTMTDNATLSALASTTVQTFNPTSNRDVRLPASPATGLTYVIKHFGTAHALAVLDSAGSSIDTVYAGGATTLVYDGTAWQVF